MQNVKVVISSLPAPKLKYFFSPKRKGQSRNRSKPASTWDEISCNLLLFNTQRNSLRQIVTILCKIVRISENLSVTQLVWVCSLKCGRGSCVLSCRELASFIPLVLKPTRPDMNLFLDITREKHEYFSRKHVLPPLLITINLCSFFPSLKV